jgi:hypothetical protein
MLAALLLAIVIQSLVPLVMFAYFRIRIVGGSEGALNTIHEAGLEGSTFMKTPMGVLISALGVTAVMSWHTLSSKSAKLWRQKVDVSNRCESVASLRQKAQAPMATSASYSWVPLVILPTCLLINAAIGVAYYPGYDIPKRRLLHESPNRGRLPQFVDNAIPVLFIVVPSAFTYLFGAAFLVWVFVVRPLEMVDLCRSRLKVLSSILRERLGTEKREQIIENGEQCNRAEYFGLLVGADQTITFVNNWLDTRRVIITVHNHFVLAQIANLLAALVVTWAIVAVALFTPVLIAILPGGTLNRDSTGGNQLILCDFAEIVVYFLALGTMTMIILAKIASLHDETTRQSECLTECRETVLRAMHGDTEVCMDGQDRLLIDSFFRAVSDLLKSSKVPETPKMFGVRITYAHNTAMKAAFGSFCLLAVSTMASLAFHNIL